MASAGKRSTPHHCVRARVGTMTSFILRHLSWDEQIAVRTMWAECRGEPDDGQRAVAHVLLNRTDDGRWGNSLASVCLAKLQFSCWNHTDPQRVRMAALKDDEPALLSMLVKLTEAQKNREADPTQGALYYYSDSIAPPFWAEKMTFLRKIGHHSFFTDKPKGLIA